MASWAVHFRIADSLIDKLNIDEKHFIIGNIAPDCGVPVKGGYYPSSEVTHLTHCGNYKGNCDYNSIYAEHLVDNDDIESYSFWLGYYVHLITDCLWVNDLCQLVCDDFNNLEYGSPLSGIIRREWYNLDFHYFENNNSYTFEKFKGYKSFDDNFTDFYNNDEISKQLINIVDFYTNNKSQPIDYVYTTPEMVENFIINSSDKIYKNLLKAGLI